VAGRRSIKYVESVSGTRQKVDFQLREDAFISAKSGRDLAKVETRYDEPIAAMQDFDLQFPEPVKFAYYSLYNLFRRYALIEQIDDWRIVNQTLAAKADRGGWLRMLREAIDSAKEEAAGN
jgi:hypothetical protein